MSGTTEVAVEISKQGDVSKIIGILEPEGSEGLFRAAAAVAARKWKFSTESSDKARIYFIKFHFKMMPKDTSIFDLTTIVYPNYEMEVRCLKEGLRPIFESGGGYSDPSLEEERE